jgi:hypothetical protein
MNAINNIILVVFSIYYYQLGKTIAFNDHHETFSMAAKDGVKFLICE